jgi:hypothetical protein
MIKTARNAPVPITGEDSWPVIPDRVDDLRIPRSLVTDLILRYLWLHGAGTLATLNTALKLSFPVLEILFHHFRQQQLLEVKGMLGNDYSFTLTGAGRALAMSRNEVCQYAGPAPVSIQQYHQVVKAQAAHVKLSRESLRRAFHDLVLPNGLLDALGPSLIGHQSLFLYGGTGNGKTSIAERILRIYDDTVVVPYAVEVDGHIITLFDPVVHRLAPGGDEMLDPRWVVCERPCITVGGSGFHFALPDEGQQRHPDHRRLRAADAVAARTAEPVDCSARPADRLPDAGLRHEVPGAIRTVGGILDQPESARLGR